MGRKPTAYSERKARVVIYVGHRLLIEMQRAHRAFGGARTLSEFLVEDLEKRFFSTPSYRRYLITQLRCQLEQLSHEETLARIHGDSQDFVVEDLRDFFTKDS
jgi:hypothetical protein